jgi:molybdate transport system ATP-binding protein
MIRCDVRVARGTFRLDAALHATSRVSGLFGPTGSGKTTLLLALAGLVRPARGRIEVNGVSFFDSERGTNVPPEKRGLGVVFQEGRLFPHLTVRGNLRFSRPSPRAAGPGFDEIVRLLDLEPLLDRPIAELSGGQARLVAVGRALMARPRLLLLDEPLTGLDPARRRSVLAYLLRIKDSLDVTVLLVSHVFSDHLALADEVALIHDGRIATTGTPEDVMVNALGEAGAGTVETTLPGTVVEVSGTEATVDCSGARFILHLEGAAAGDTAYITVNAQEALLAVGDAPRTSARNVLRGTVARIREAEDHVLVEIDAGPRIWAEVTAGSLQRLGLAPGRETFVLIKAAAVRGVALPAAAPAAPAG